MWADGGPIDPPTIDQAINGATGVLMDFAFTFRRRCVRCKADEAPNALRSSAAR